MKPKVPSDSAAFPRKRAEWLATAIEDRVEKEHLQPGTSLGTEPQLIARYGVSRETLRNAIRLLERHGVAAMRRGGGGGGGGLIVAAPASQTAMRAITAHLELSDIGWSEITEARALIDVEAAVRAAERIDGQGAERLRALGAALDAGPATVRDIARRHMALPDAIAEIGGNPVLQLFSEALSAWTSDVLPSELGPSEVRDRETRRVNDILRRLADAIARGDVPAARREAETFADSSLAVSRLLETHRRRRPIDEWLAIPAEGGNKLAQRLALALATEVAARAWPRERFGAEAELMTRFGVSRATLREAIRMLEMHGIARPQRGRGGGLMIGTPNPAYTIESAKRYLRRAGLDSIDYLSVRGTLEAGAIRLAIQRASDAEMRSLAGHAEAIQQADDAGVTPTAIAWHARLSELTHNRALSLLLRILFALTEEPQQRLPPDIAEVLRSRHHGLTQAITARDEARALAVAKEHILWLEQVLELGLGRLSVPADNTAA